MIRWMCAFLIAGIVSGFALLLVSGQYITDGPVLVAISPGHGLHIGDLIVVAGWAVAMVALSLLARRGERERR